mgnify:CR=1 FL=1
MTKMKPTIREVRVVLEALGIDSDEITNHWNDQRVRGGRIKFYYRSGSAPLDTCLGQLNDRLGSLFPDYKVEVTSYGRGVYTVHFKETDDVTSCPQLDYK